LARPYDQHHRKALGAQLHLPLTERACPKCDHVAMREYHHETYGRSTPPWINYMWCANCHAYSSSFTAAGRKMVQSFLAEYGDRIGVVFDDPERPAQDPRRLLEGGKTPPGDLPPPPRTQLLVETAPGVTAEAITAVTDAKPRTAT
jgi:hypothetical protein